MTERQAVPIRSDPEDDARETPGRVWEEHIRWIVRQAMEDVRAGHTTELVQHERLAAATKEILQASRELRHEVVHVRAVGPAAATRDEGRDRMATEALHDTIERLDRTLQQLSANVAQLGQILQLQRDLIKAELASVNLKLDAYNSNHQMLAREIGELRSMVGEQLEELLRRSGR